MRLTPAPMPRRPWPPLPLALSLGLPLALVACRSAEEYRLAADEEVYAILEQRRADLDTEGFILEGRGDTLRRRIEAAVERGEALELEPLGLVECLEIAAENSRDYQDRREQLYLAALDLTLERWRFQVQETATASGSVSGTGTDAESANFSADLGLSKLLGSGALIVGGIGIDLFRALSTGDGWDAISGASLSVTQPLLRGFGVEVVTEPLTQAERDVLYEVRAYERFRRTFAFDVTSQVFRIAQQVDTLRNEETNFESLTRIRERNEALAEAGQLLSLEVDQARQEELRARTRVVEAGRGLEALYDDFKLFLGLPLETPLVIRDEELKDLFGLTVPVAVLEEGPAVEVALTERLDYRTVVGRAEDAARRLALAEDDLRAGLDLVVNANLTSDEGQPTEFNGNNAPWSTSLLLDLPIDQLPERNAYRAALISHDAARRNRVESEDFVRADIRDALREVAAAREQLEIETNAVTLAERRVEGASMNLEAGRAETRDLLESQEDLVQFRNRSIQSQVDLTLARLALYRDMGLLRVDRAGLRVEIEPLTAGGE